MNHARHKSDSNDHFPVCSPFLWLSQEQGAVKANRLVKNMNVPLILPEDDKPLSCNKALIQLLNTKQSVILNYIYIWSYYPEEPYFNLKNLTI